MFWSTGLCRISRDKRWHISAPESFKGLTNALLVENYLVSKIVKRESFPVITAPPFGFFSWGCWPDHTLIFAFSSVFSTLFLFIAPPAHWSWSGSSIAIRQSRECLLTTQVVGIPSQRFCLRWLKRRWPRLRFSHQCSLLKQPERYRSGDESYHTLKHKHNFLFNSEFVNENM